MSTIAVIALVLLLAALGAGILAGFSSGSSVKFLEATTEVLLFAYVLATIALSLVALGLTVTVHA